MRDGDGPLTPQFGPLDPATSGEGRPARNEVRPGEMPQGEGGDYVVSTVDTGSGVVPTKIRQRARIRRPARGRTRRDAAGALRTAICSIAQRARRVALPGVQPLFGFLLIVPFQSGSRTSPVPEVLYFVVLLLTTIATALLIAPTALPPPAVPLEMKPVIVDDSNRLAIAGGWRLLALEDHRGRDAGDDVLFGAVACAIVDARLPPAYVRALWLNCLSPARARRRGPVSGRKGDHNA